MKRKAVLGMIFGIAALGFTPTGAAAQYLDPGTSSVIVQVLVAGLVGVAAVLKLYWQKIKMFFSSSAVTSGKGSAEQPDGSR